MDIYLFLLITISLGTLTFHCIGAYLLFKTKCSPSFSGNQRIFLLVISFTDIFISIFIFIEETFYSEVVNDVFEAFQDAGLWVFYVFLMIYITIDRLLLIHLNIRYPLYCTEKTTGIVLGIIGLLCVGNFADQ